MHHKFPKELIHIILAYDGRIKYKNGKYINVIHPADTRYTNLKPIIEKMLNIFKTGLPSTHDTHTTDLYFELEFEKEKETGLCYAGGSYSAAAYTERNKIEITYFNFKNNKIQQNRTYV